MAEIASSVEHLTESVQYQQEEALGGWMNLLLDWMSDTHAHANGTAHVHAIPHSNGLNTCNMQHTLLLCMPMLSILILNLQSCWKVGISNCC